MEMAQKIQYNKKRSQMITMSQSRISSGLLRTERTVLLKCQKVYNHSAIPKIKSERDKIQINGTKTMTMYATKNQLNTTAGLAAAWRQLMKIVNLTCKPYRKIQIAINNKPIKIQLNALCAIDIF